MTNTDKEGVGMTEERAREILKTEEAKTRIYYPSDHVSYLNSLTTRGAAVRAIIEASRQVSGSGGAEERVWVVVGNDHNYDAGNQWVVGVFRSEESANVAANEDRKKYRGQIKPSQVEYDIEDFTLPITPHPDTVSDAMVGRAMTALSKAVGKNTSVLHEDVRAALKAALAARNGG